MKFVALFDGKEGPGCDYTINCGQMHTHLEASGYLEAVKKLEAIVEDYGGKKRFKKVEMFRIDKMRVV